MRISLLVCCLFVTTLIKAQLVSLPSAVYNLDSIAAIINDAKVKPKAQGSTTDLAMLSYHASTLDAGKTNHPLKALDDREELIIVKTGQLTIHLNDSGKIIGPGGIALIVAGDRQSFENRSKEPVSYMVFGFKAKAPVDIQRGITSGGSLVYNYEELTVKKTAKGESRPVFDRPSSMFPRFEVHATLLNAGEESHAPHTHRAEEIMLVMKGNITMNIDSKSYKAGVGDAILVRPDVPHNLKNTGMESCWYYAIKWFDKISE